MTRLLSYALILLAGCRAASTPGSRVPLQGEASHGEPFEPPPMYAALFDDGATFTYQGEIVNEDDDSLLKMRCRVGDVRRYQTAVAARLGCTGVGYDEEPDELPLPVEASPGGVYAANADGLYRIADLPGYAAPPTLAAESLVMLPTGKEITLRQDDTHEIALYRSEERGMVWCRHESMGGSWPEAGVSFALCFRPGAGLVGGGYTVTKGDQRLRGHYELAARTLGRRATPASAPPVPALVINEIAAGDADDWFELVNTSSAPILLDQLVYSDRPDDFARVVAFAPVTLMPGARHVQPVDLATSGFRLNGTESLSIYRSADLAPVASVAWDEGASPPGGSWARVPDVTGAWSTAASSTPGAENR